MGKVTDKDVEYVAKLAHLSLSEEEKKHLAKDLSQILSYAETLNKLDTDNIDGTANILGIENVLREDCVGESADREELLKNAPESNEQAIIVPRIVE